MPDLERVGMEKGLLYETIVTTKDDKGNPNAAPIGVLCKDYDQLILYLYEGSKTLKNINNNHQFMVNITQDPLIFVDSILKDSEQEFEEYKDQYIIKNADAFIWLTADKIREVLREDKLGKSKLSIIHAQVKEVIKKKEHVRPLNRAIYVILESLIYYSRLKMADENIVQEYVKRIRENKRIVDRVGGKKYKLAMKKIINNINTIPND